MNAKKYCYLFFVVVPILAVLVIGLNILVDPQGAFRLIDVKGVNHYVIKNNALGRVGNSYNLYLNQYDTVLLGTSRVQSGIDPRMGALSGKAVFNGSLGDTELLEIVAEMEFILSHQTDLKEVYLGLDLHAFSKNREVHSEYEKSLFNPDTTLIWNFLRNSLNSRTLEDVIGTLSANIKGTPEKHWINGHYHSDALVEHRSTIENILTIYMGRKEMFGCFEYDENKRNELTKVLEKYAAAGIKLNLFISPQHAKNLLILEQVDSMQTYYDWIRDMSMMTETINTQHPNAINLWNFSGFNIITTEPIVYGKQQMEFYFETSHYKDNVGEMIIETIQSGQVNGDFGERLLPSSIDSLIEGMRSAASKYKSAYPHEITDLARIASDTEATRSEYSCSNRN